MRIAISPEERVSQTMSETHVQEALGAIRTEGYVVLEDVVAHEHLDILRKRMDEDARKLIDAEHWGGAGRLPGHLQQGPPPFAPYVFSDVVANPYVVQVCKALLGEGLYNSFYNGNTNSPGNSRQPLHRDGGHLWPGLKIAHPTASVVVNVPPQEVTEENGAIELWPGSHLDTATERRIEEADEEARRKIAPPIRGVSKKGDVLIRDIRLWHRGVPNVSDHPRHMIALIYNARWLQRGKPIRYNKGCEDAFTHPDLDHNAEFTDEPLDYLFRHTRETLARERA